MQLALKFNCTVFQGHIFTDGDFSPEHRASLTAFMKILDSLQKRRMNTGLCERIRKVYGDLECEYCGKGWGRARGWGALFPAAQPATWLRVHLLFELSSCLFAKNTF